MSGKNREKAELLFDAITAVREDLIEAAQNYVFRRRTSAWRRYAALAACLALAAGLGFGALRLGLLGGMGGSSNTGADNGAAPESSGETSGADDAGGDAGTEEMTFSAAVLEVRDGWLLVEPLEGEAILASADRVMVSLAGVEAVPDLEPGDQVAITFDGMIQESYPAQVTATAVGLLPAEGDLP